MQENLTVKDKDQVEKQSDENNKDDGFFSDLKDLTNQIVKQQVDPEQSYKNEIEGYVERLAKDFEKPQKSEKQQKGEDEIPKQTPQLEQPKKEEQPSKQEKNIKPEQVKQKETTQNKEQLQAPKQTQAPKQAQSPKQTQAPKQTQGAQQPVEISFANNSRPTFENNDEKTNNKTNLNDFFAYIKSLSYERLKLIISSLALVIVLLVITISFINYRNESVETFAPISPQKYEYFSEKEKYENIVVSMPEITIQAVDSTLKALTGDFGNRDFRDQGNILAANYLQSCFEKMGYSEQNLVVQEYYYDFSPPETAPRGLVETTGAFPEPGTVDPVYQKNIVAIVNGENDSVPIITMSAHYDSHNIGEGSVDNASGVSAVVAIAEYFKQHDIKPKCEIRFLLLSTEEFGYHGAKNYFEQLTSHEKKRHVATINIDMAGHDVRNQNSVITFSSMGAIENKDTSVASKHNEIPNIVSKTLAETYEKYGNFAQEMFPSALLFKDDARIFFNRGINVSTISWREKDFEKSFNVHGLVAPKIIHTSEDTYQNTDKNSIKDVTNLAFKALMILDYEYNKEIIS